MPKPAFRSFVLSFPLFAGRTHRCVSARRRDRRDGRTGHARRSIAAPEPPRPSTGTASTTGNDRCDQIRRIDLGDAQDPAGRTAAAKLAVVGLLAIEEIGSDGRLRPLTPADVLMASSRFGWRVTLAGALA